MKLLQETEETCQGINRNRKVLKDPQNTGNKSKKGQMRLCQTETSK